MKFYSKTTGGFYAEDVHGPRKISVLDPSWVATQIEVPDPLEEDKTILIDDPENPPKFDIIDNPDCLIPMDAVEVSDESHAELIGMQAHGKIIAPDANGNPVAINPPPLSEDELAVSVRARRDVLLSQCDWVVTRAVESGTAVSSDWHAYRQALRDITGQSGFPSTINWPTAPE